jgi:hypothetical protein
MDKNPVQNVQKCPHFLQKSSKKYRKVWYLFKKPGKRFEGFICTYTRGICIDLRNPRLAMYNYPGSHVLGGDK